jgi:cell division GTPase FtsZ
MGDATMSKVTQKQSTHGSGIDQLQAEIANLSTRVAELTEKESAAAAEEERISGALGALVGRGGSPSEVGKARRRLRQIEEERADLRAGRQWLLNSRTEVEACLAAARTQELLALLHKDLKQIRARVDDLLARESESAAAGRSLQLLFEAFLTHARSLRSSSPGEPLPDLPDCAGILAAGMTGGIEATLFT